MAKKNWLKEDLDHLKSSLWLTAGLILVPLAPFIWINGPRELLAFAMQGYILGSFILAERAWREPERLKTLLGDHAVFARPLLAFAALVFTAICGLLMMTRIGRFSWSIAVFWLPSAIGFVLSIWDFTPSVQFKPWSGAAVLKLGKKKASPAKR